MATNGRLYLAIMFILRLVYFCIIISINYTSGLEPFRMPKSTCVYLVFCFCA